MVGAGWAAGPSVSTGGFPTTSKPSPCCTDTGLKKSKLPVSSSYVEATCLVESEMRMYWMGIKARVMQTTTSYKQLAVSDLRLPSNTWVHLRGLLVRLDVLSIAQTASNTEDLAHFKYQRHFCLSLTRRQTATVQRQIMFHKCFESYFWSFL